MESISYWKSWAGVTFQLFGLHSNLAIRNFMHWKFKKVTTNTQKVLWKKKKFCMKLRANLMIQSGFRGWKNTTKTLICRWIVTTLTTFKCLTNFSITDLMDATQSWLSKCWVKTCCTWSNSLTMRAFRCQLWGRFPNKCSSVWTTCTPLAALFTPIWNQKMSCLRLMSKQSFRFCRPKFWTPLWLICTSRPSLSFWTKNSSKTRKRTNVKSKRRKSRNNNRCKLARIKTPRKQKMKKFKQLLLHQLMKARMIRQRRRRKKMKRWINKVRNLKRKLLWSNFRRNSNKRKMNSRPIMSFRSREEPYRSILLFTANTIERY